MCVSYCRHVINDPASLQEKGRKWDANVDDQDALPTRQVAMFSTQTLNNVPTLGNKAVFFGNVSACVFWCAAGQTAVHSLRAACGTAAVIRDAAAGVCVERDPR